MSILYGSRPTSEVVVTNEVSGDVLWTRFDVSEVAEWSSDLRVVENVEQRPKEEKSPSLGISFGLSECFLSVVDVLTVFGGASGGLLSVGSDDEEGGEGGRNPGGATPGIGKNSMIDRVWVSPLPWFHVSSLKDSSREF